MPLIRLSVIIAATSGPSFAERAIGSVFNQADPIGIEVVAICPDQDSGVRGHLESVFARQVSVGILRFAQAKTTHVSRLLNEGARVASGHFLAFLDSKDQWLYGRLIELWPILESSDLILSPRAEHAQSEDWLKEYLRSYQGSLSSAVIRKSLFETAGGFPLGRGSCEYELWLRSLSLLERSGRKKRFIALPSHNIKFESSALPKNWRLRRREAVSILRQIPNLPRGYGAVALRSSFSRFLSFA